MFGLVEITTGLVVLFGALYYYLTSTFGYWKKKGVPFIDPQIPFGIFTDLFLLKNDVGRSMMNWYTKYKSQGLKFVGAFTFRQPTLLIFDLELCKHMLTKDFNHFVSRNMFPPTHEYLTKHLVSLEGQEWKDMRVKLTPTFTSGKMKHMFVLMKNCAKQLQDHIEQEELKKGEFDVKNLLVRFTTDIIATCAFGLEVNSLKDENNDFFKVGQKIFTPKMVNFLKIVYHTNFPKLSNIFRVNVIDPSVEPMLSKVMRDTVKYRKENNVVRNDFVDLLLKVKENRSLEDHDEDNHHIQQHVKEDTKQRGPDSLTMEQMTAQAFIFFAAGFETAASTTSFCLYELAKSPSVQQRLRREIDQVLSRHGGELTYQALQDMPYMDQVINETLRMYASLPFLTRVCTESYQIPDTDLVIEEGVRVTIPIYAIHHDPEIYPEPYKFDPERFSEENSKERHHYSFMPFGEGPRNCIGMRFGRLQVKAGLVAILSRYCLSLGPNTPDKLELDPRIFLTTPKHPFSLRISRRMDN